VYGFPKLGDRYVLNLDSLEVLGQKVIGLGQTRGWERGTIIAYGYEWEDDATPGARSRPTTSSWAMRTSRSPDPGTAAS